MRKPNGETKLYGRKSKKQYAYRRELRFKGAIARGELKLGDAVGKTKLAKICHADPRRFNPTRDLGIPALPVKGYHKVKTFIVENPNVMSVNVKRFEDDDGENE